MTDVQVESLIEHGPGYRDPAVQCVGRIGDEILAVSRVVDPCRIGVFDLGIGTVTGYVELPDGWSGYHAGGAVAAGRYYFMSYGSTVLYRFDPANQDLEVVMDLPIPALADPFAVGATDGLVCVGSKHGEVLAIDPATDAITARWTLPGEPGVVRLACTDDTIFVSAGPPAAMYAIDRESGSIDRLEVPALDGERIVKFFDVSQRWLVIGTTPGAKVVIIDRETFTDQRVVTPEPDGKTIQTLVIADDRALFHLSVLDDHGRSFPLYWLDLTTAKATKMYTLPGRLNPIGLFADDPPVVVPKQSPSFGRGEPLVTVDGPGGSATIVDLQAGGYPARPGPPQSLTGVTDRVVVGGHALLSIHRPGDGEPHAVGMIGEPKVTAVLGETVYIASYPGAFIQRYRPDDEEPTVIATVGHDQNRPRDIAVHPDRGSLFVGTHPIEGVLGGAVVECDPRTGALTVDRHPFEDHSIGAVLPDGESVILGTEIPWGVQYRGMDLPDSAKLLGWDPAARSITWELTPAPGEPAVRSLVAHDGLVYGNTPDGTIFELDPAGPAVTRTLTRSGADGTLFEHAGTLFGITTDSLYRIDPDSLSSTDLLTGLDANWYNWPDAVSIDGSLYTIRGTSLIEVQLAIEPT